MPDNQEQTETQEIKENKTSIKEDDILKKYNDLQEKVNVYYLKRKEALKEDPIFEMFEKIGRDEE